MTDTRRPWNSRERTMVANWLRLNMTCSAIGREFHLSKQETVARIVADEQLHALRPTLKGLNPDQRRNKGVSKIAPPPTRSIVAETPMRERPAARVDPMLGYKDVDVVDRPLPPMPVVPVSGMRLVGLADLDPGECKWPVGERDDVVGKVLFCGKTCSSGSYCKAHTHISLPPREQRRKGAVGPRPRENEVHSRLGRSVNLARGLNFDG